MTETLTDFMPLPTPSTSCNSNALRNTRGLHIRELNVQCGFLKYLGFHRTGLALTSMRWPHFMWNRLLTCVAPLSGWIVPRQIISLPL